ncbi:MAG: tRNA (adenosine(37)-N6)-threonylcarbamoyltransferase complex dimerization subunit type 1 TsaB [Planctomycetia bacterium]
MKTLAIDTSLATGAVAALDGDRVAVRSLPTAGEHARLLAAAIEAVAAELGWRPADAALVAVITGPGSFTGLRVGVTTAKAVCWATGARLLGVSSCEVIARAVAAAEGPTGAPVTIAFDAGRGEVYAAVVTPDGRSPSGWRAGAGSIHAAHDWLASLPAGSRVCGPGLAVVADALPTRPDLMIAPWPMATHLIVELGRIALLRAAAGEADDPAALVPDYIRPSYADEKRSAAP